jgi:hypothetical protein
MKKTELILNAPILADRGERNESGRIYFANESRFSAGRLSEPLTAYLAGIEDPTDLAGLLERLAPEVPAGRFFSYRLMDNAKALLSETEDDLRAIGSDFKRVDYSGSTAEGKTDNRGLTIRLDLDEDTDSNELRQAYTRLLQQRLLRNRLRRAIALIDAAGTNANVAFTAATNPDGLMRAMVNAGRDAAGVRPTKVVIGDTAWQYRLDAYEAAAAAGSTLAPAALNRDEAALARYLGVQDVVPVSAMYQSAAATKSQIVGSAAYAYYAEAGLTKMDPSNVKRFVSNTKAGTKTAVWVEEHPKFVDISVECYERTIVVATTGMRKITVANS